MGVAASVRALSVIASACGFTVSSTVASTLPGYPSSPSGDVQSEQHATIVPLAHIEHAPHPLAETQRAAMQVIGALVGGDLVGPAIEIEAAASDAIAEPADERTHVGAIAHVLLEAVEMQDEVAAHAAHRIAETAQDCAIGEHFQLQAGGSPSVMASMLRPSSSRPNERIMVVSKAGATSVFARREYLRSRLHREHRFLGDDALRDRLARHHVLDRGHELRARAAGCIRR